MTTFLSKEVQDGLAAARIASLRKASRLRVHADGEVFPVLYLWHDGFAVAADAAQPLRGLVDLYDGARHLYQCLIVASEFDNGEMRYEFKRSTQASDHAPLDFYRDPQSPIALLPR